jgi:acyl carrier protein
VKLTWGSAGRSQSKGGAVVDEEEVLGVLAEATGLERGELGTEWSLLDLGLTSFRIMQALMELEERFGIEFSEDEVVKFPTVPTSALPRFVRERIAGSSG